MYIILQHTSQMLSRCPSCGDYRLRLLAWNTFQDSSRPYRSIFSRRWHVLGRPMAWGSPAMMAGWHLVPPQLILPSIGSCVESALQHCKSISSMSLQAAAHSMASASGTAGFSGRVPVRTARVQIIPQVGFSAKSRSFQDIRRTECAAGRILIALHVSIAYSGYCCQQENIPWFLAKV